MKVMEETASVSVHGTPVSLLEHMRSLRQEARRRRWYDQRRPGALEVQLFLGPVGNPDAKLKGSPRLLTLFCLYSGTTRRASPPSHPAPKREYKARI